MKKVFIFGIIDLFYVFLSGDCWLMSTLDSHSDLKMFSIVFLLIGTGYFFVCFYYLIKQPRSLDFIGDQFGSDVGDFLKKWLPSK